MDVVYLGDGGFVLGASFHELREPLVEGEDDVHADAEIGGYEEGAATLKAEFLHLGATVVPAGSAYHDGYVQQE